MCLTSYILKASRYRKVLFRSINVCVCLPTLLQYREAANLVKGCNANEEEQ